jgi:CBS domain-containing protein
MLEEKFFFVRVKELCRGPVITCAPDEDVVSVARILRDRNISGLVVCEGSQPLGVITDRDFRNLLVRTDGAISGHRAAEIMSSPLITVRCDDYVFEAIYRMARHNIHRLIVVDDGGGLAGIVTDTDIIALQTRTPLYFSREVESAGSLEELQRTNRNLLKMVSFATRAGAGTRDVVRLIAHFNDTITRRVIGILEEKEGVRLPPRAAYLALGSEGRMEQTLRTDQDSAVVYGDGLAEPEVAQVEKFSVRLIESLVQIGVPPCPGGTMANNPQWRRTLTEWKRALDQWMTVLKPEHMVNFGMFQDLRTVHGDDGLTEELKAHIRATVARNSLFLPYVARNIIRFPPALGLFGRFRVERSGEYKGKINLKKAGIFAITEGVSLLALEVGVLDGSTWEKIEALGERGVLPQEDLGRLDEAFTLLVRLRLAVQLKALEMDQKPTNYVDPQFLSPSDTDGLRAALNTVGSFLRTIRDRYQLNFISR